MPNCPKCQRPVKGSRTHCMWCGEALPPWCIKSSPETPLPSDPPPPTPDFPDLLVCPHCPVQGLARAELSGLTIHRCPVCRGIFLDGTTFDFLIERQAKLAIQSEGPVRPRDVQRAEIERHVRYIRCPVCRQQMLRKNYAKCSGVIFDHCLGHGVWLDDAELQSLLAFVATGGHRLAQQLADEAQRRLRRARRPKSGHHPAGGMGMWGF